MEGEEEEVRKVEALTEGSEAGFSTLFEIQFEMVIETRGGGEREEEEEHFQCRDLGKI